MATTTDLKGIGQILVPVSNVDRAVEFYENVLGLPVQMRFPGIAFMDAAGVRLYLAVVPQADFQGRATIYFWVEGVTATWGRLLARGATARQEPHGPVRRAGLRPVDGLRDRSGRQPDRDHARGAEGHRTRLTRALRRRGSAQREIREQTHACR